jgi:signal transduction histidine kinase/ligand-binding sensor domain-containing protein
LIARTFALFLALAALGSTASALPRDRTIHQLHHTAWTAKEGAPSQIGAIAQTRDGYLWIGSALGLFRFDGVRFERFRPPSGVKMPSHNIYSLLATDDGGLWISFRPSGLGYLDAQGGFTTFTRPEEVPASPVYMFARDGDGRLWAGTHDGLVLRTGSSWTPVGQEWSVTPARVWDMRVDGEGTLWVATPDWVASLKRGSKTFVTLPQHSSRSVRLGVDLQGTVWIATDVKSIRRVHPLTAGTTASLSIAENGSGEDVHQLLFDRDGALWANDIGRGVHRVRFPDQPSTAERFSHRDGLSSDVVNTMFEDREGNLWVGTVRGLDRFRYSHIVPTLLPENLQRLTLVAAPRGDLLVAAASHGKLVELRGDASTVREMPTLTSSVYRADDGDLWFGFYGGLARIRNGTIRGFEAPSMLPVDWAWEVFRCDEGGLWVGYGDVGLVHFEDGVWGRRKPPAALLQRVPSASFHAADRRIWLGYTENRAAVLEGGKVTRYTSADGIEIGRIRVIRGRGQHLWFGGELGLAFFQGGKFYAVATSSGERFGTVSGIIETADGTLWLNEMRGIIRISAAETRRLQADPRHRVSYELFDFLDGLPGAPQMNWTVSTAVEGTDGRLWFATDNGLARIDPAHLVRSSVAPPVAIDSVVADREYDAQHSPDFPVHTRQLQFRYTALSFAIPERVRFESMLEGVDETWRDAGTRREAFYTNLRPGSYVFRVRASNHDGVRNDRGASFAFELPAAFYETRWFAALLVVLGAIGLWLLYRFRVRRVAATIQRLYDERLDERARIARELHDTLLQGFLSASMQLYVARERVGDSSPAKPIIDNVLELVTKVSEEGRHALLGLRVSDSTEPLEDALSRAKFDLAEQREIGFRIIVTGTARPLHPLVRDEIYRIGREALGNAFQHSAAANVEVHLEYLPERLLLRIRDDGRGMDPAEIEMRRGDHWGLAGMQERADKIGAQLTITSRSGIGTEVELSVPLRGAGSRRWRRWFTLRASPGR